MTPIEAEKIIGDFHKSIKDSRPNGIIQFNKELPYTSAKIKYAHFVYGEELVKSVKITEENVKKVLTAAGVKADDVKIKALTASLDGVNIDEAIKTAVVPVAAAAPAPAEGKPEEKKEEKKKKEEKEEVSEEEAAAGLGALFG